MDLPINKIHRILLDAGLPSTIEDLKAPTEEYVVNLLTTSLERFNIDVNSISQPTAEQYNIMPYHESSNIISIINLYTVMAKIFDKIFINDFNIIDITDPGQKRLRKQAKFISNFILYVIQTKLKLNERINDIQDRVRLLEEIKTKKAYVQETINTTAIHKAKQLSLIKELENEIKHVRLKKEKLNEKELKLELMKNKEEKENQKAKERFISVKATAEKLFKAISELQSEVVHSPEQFQSRLSDLEEQERIIIEERNIVQEAIQDKKHCIKQIETKMDFVLQKMNGKLPTLKTITDELKNKKTQLDNIKKQIDSLENILSESQKKITTHKVQVDTEKNDLQSYRKSDIDPLFNLHKQLLSEKKLKESQFEANRVCLNEKCSERDRLLEDIRKVEEQSKSFLHSCQELYDKEIESELEIRNAFKE